MSGQSPTFQFAIAGRTRVMAMLKLATVRILNLCVCQLDCLRRSTPLVEYCHTLCCVFSSVSQFVMIELFDDTTV